MKTVTLDTIFDISYGHSLELNRMKQNASGINFVARTAKNNGVSARVDKIDGLEPAEAGLITVAVSGSVLETFVQPRPFYTSYHILLLKPKQPMSLEQKLYYCACVRANRYRYSYGRQANRTLKDLHVPALSEVPDFARVSNQHGYQEISKPLISSGVQKLEPKTWKPFLYSDLFDIKKGKRLTKQHMTEGSTPYIGSSDTNNGLTATIGQPPMHQANTISVCYNGSVAEAFYQPEEYWATDDVNVLYPKFELNKYTALFLTTLIRKEKYRYSYGRKWHLGRMNESTIKLPVNEHDEPDWLFMEKYIKGLPFSSGI